MTGLVLGSWPGMEADHNRFLQILLGALEAEGVRVVSFPESRDIDLAGLDALLVHWPDKLFWEAAGSAEAAALIIRLTARLALRPRPVKLVWMVHDLRPHDGRWFKRLAWPPYAAMLAQLADGALTLSSGTRAVVQAAYPVLGRKPFEHIWHPAYPGEAVTPEVRAAARAGFGWRGAERVYGYCGQLRPYKGVEDLIAAFAGLADPDARLLIAGRPRDPGIAATLESLAGGDPRIRLEARDPFAGGVPRLPRRLRPRGGAVPALSALGLDRARAERRATGADALDALRAEPRGRARPPRLAADLRGPADAGDAGGSGPPRDPARSRAPGAGRCGPAPPPLPRDPHGPDPGSETSSNDQAGAE